MSKKKKKAIKILSLVAVEWHCSGVIDGVTTIGTKDRILVEVILGELFQFV